MSITSDSTLNHIMLLSFPNEVLLLIGENIDNAKDVYSLLFTNRRLSLLFIPRLRSLACSNEFSTPAFFWAAASGNETMVKFLLENGSLKLGLYTTDSGSYPGIREVLHESPAPCSDSIVQLVMSQGANLRLISGWRPLGYAIANKRMRLARLLLRKGGSTNSMANGYGMDRVLNMAIRRSAVEVVKLLLEEGVRMSGAGPLYRAVSSGNEEIVKLLLDYGALSVALPVGEPRLLGFATMNGGIEVVRLLLERGVDVREKDTFERTALHMVDSVEIAELLLKNGADIHARDYLGRTAQDMARNSSAVEFLREYADNNVRENEGKRVLDGGDSGSAE